MAILALDPSDPAADGSRWATMRTSLPAAWLRPYWLAWTVAAEVSACSSLAVILIILLRPHLRSQAFNKLIVGLVLPDFVFSFVCGWTCLSNYAAGHWHGGVAVCNVQGFYLTYGVSAAVWMDLLIARELHSLAVSLGGVSIYRTPSASAVWARIGCVHLAALVYAAIPMLPGVPAAFGQHRGLVCFSIEYDRDSTLFHWLFNVTVADVVPTVVLLWYCKRIYTALFHGAAEVHAADRAIFSFFLQQLAVFIILWHPIALLGWVITWDSELPAHLIFYGGILSHLQGMVSAVLQVRKPDIWAEVLLLVAACRGRATRCLRRGMAQPSSSDAAWRPDMADGGSLAATATPTADLLLQQLSAGVMARITQQEQAPMRVVELDTWLGLKRFPRSSDSATRPLEDGDVVVFISHRWWAPDYPDDESGTKYSRISRGTLRLAARHRLNPSRVVLWCDWACIDQDDLDLKARGVASLITYAARSSFVLIPVPSDPACVRAFRAAKHPMMLREYGERAWCRLEVYIFMCVSEICRKPPYCYGYGPARVGGSCWPARDVLRPLMQDFARGAAFDVSKLPSAGDLTCEADRAVIWDVEQEMRAMYTRTAILAERLRLESAPRQRVCSLQEKQIRCVDVPMLAGEIFGGQLAARIVELRLDGNLLGADGVAELLGGVVCAKATSTLAVLSLSNNPHLGSGGVRHIAGWMPHPCFALASLSLSRCHLEDEAMQPLVESLPNCMPLQHLDLSYNNLGDSCCEALIEACGGCDHPVVRLDLDGNPLSTTCVLKASRARIAMELGRRSKLPSGGLPSASCSSSCKSEVGAGDERVAPSAMVVDLDTCGREDIAPEPASLVTAASSFN